MNSLARGFTSALLLTVSQAAAAPHWITHASAPGADLPAFGQSRFEQLFAAPGGGFAIPYPIERLIAELEARIENGDEPGVRQVFIPIGRSLQRDAPSPDYFLYPRRVIALQGEPVAAAGDAAEVLEYRLFIAHQPKAETLEIISYNDAAGRFEFQVVDGYGPGKRATLRSANRAMCLSCHHNAAPIFPQLPWRETTFNVEVAKRLAAAQPRFTSLVDVITLDAGVIDLLSERANYLAAAQLLWQRGCDSARCRAAMLRAVLQYRLSAESSFDWHAPGFQQDLLQRLDRNWRRHWPQGLRLASSRIADRDPFAGPPAAAMDPLRPRPPQATWQQADAVLARGIIYRLGGFFTRADIQRLDRWLSARGRRQSLPVYRYQADCESRPQAQGGRLLRCGDGELAQSLHAEILIPAGGAMRVLKLRMPGDSNILQPDLLEQRYRRDRVEARPGHATAGLSQRLANGDRIRSLALQRQDSGQGYRFEIEIARESAVIEQVIATLLEREARGQLSGLGRGALRRDLIMPALTEILDMPRRRWRPASAPAARASRAPAPAFAGNLSLLARYCAHCHADAGQRPPGFLAGARAAEQVLGCAPRMLARLRAWREPPAAAPAPMPPPASIAYSGTDAARWPHSDDYRKLVVALEQLLVENRRLADSTALEYRALPPCVGGLSE